MWSSEIKQKDDFAAEWIRSNDPFKAAIVVFGPDNAGRALQASVEWTRDAYVIAKRAELLEEVGEEAFLPTKADLARKVLEVHENSRAPEDKLKALELYGKLMGFIAKENKTDNTKGTFKIVASELDQKI